MKEEKIVCAFINPTKSWMEKMEEKEKCQIPCHRWSFKESKKTIMRISK
jgi:hypothetical protein